MSWEAHRWTAKTPSQLLHTLGPHGVDDLVRQSFNAVWRELPDDARTFPEAARLARGVFQQNMKVWAAIKKPTPESFFADLGPTAPHHFMRQAMVLCWMMMPRAGGRDVADVRRIVGGIFERTLGAWEDDNATFTGAKKAKARKPTTRGPVKKESSRPRKAKTVGKAAKRGK